MAKISRRAYLKGMGVTAGVIATAPGRDLFAQHAQDPAEFKCPQEDKKPTLERLYAQCGVRMFDLHSTESVKLVFYGSMTFAQNSAGECVVAFRSLANLKHKHQLDIKVFRKEGSCTLMPTPQTFNNVPPGAQIQLEVRLPDLINGVQFFQPPITSGTLHDNDFRWLPNLEGPAWWNSTLAKRPNVYKPELIVTNGLFHTLHKTASTFRRQTPDGNQANVLEIGNVADYVGASIYLKSGGYVKLTVQGRDITLPQAAGVSYEIHFENECKKIANPNLPCIFNPYHPNETERSDFYMHRDGIVLTGKPQYELVLVQRGQPTALPICREHRLNDEAPCSGVGFGGPGGFPSFPPL